ncbi:hypothetical protein GGI02_005729, partial [Coemansia sp. RSA 2322]
MHENVEGRITIDKHDIGEFGVGDFRPKLGVIPQESTLFNGTVRQNLNPMAEFSIEDMWVSLIKSGVADILKQPSSDDDDDDDDELEIIDGAGANNASSAHRHNARSGWLQRMYMLISGQRELAASGDNCQRRNNGGLDRKIGGRSINRLSSGQRQLFSLCRLLMRKQGKVLVLDEATADIDSESDLKMQQLIRREFRESTVITIAHRLETIMNSDRIVVMDRGEI